MSYTWQNGQIITAEKLNNNCKIQFVNVLQDIENQTLYLDKNWQQIKDIYDAGGMVFIKFIEEATDFFGMKIGYILDIYYDEETTETIYTIRIQMSELSCDFTASNPTEQLTWIIKGSSDDEPIS